MIFLFFLCPKICNPLASVTHTGQEKKLQNEFSSTNVTQVSGVGKGQRPILVQSWSADQTGKEYTGEFVIIEGK